MAPVSTSSRSPGVVVRRRANRAARRKPTAVAICTAIRAVVVWSTDGIPSGDLSAPDQKVVIHAQYRPKPR
jgi:hypothetical protein